MSRDYTLPEFSQYMHMHELQPVGQHYPYLQNLLPSALSNQNATPAAYEMTAAASAGSACAESTLPSGPSSASLDLLDPRKRKNTLYVEYEMNDAHCSGSDRSAAASVCSSRKRKISSIGTASAYDDDCFDDSRSSRTSSTVNTDKKQNHSEIEKRRRDKMNTYITELSAMIPMCGAMARKLDKLTVLRMAVQHLRTVRGSLSTCSSTAHPRPAFVSERELNSLILQAAGDSFLIVVGCDRGRLLYVSHSVTKMLHYDQSELLGQSMFDILHPKDVAKVKEQLSSSDLSPRERLIDAKTMLPVRSDVMAGTQRLCPGARRSFFCRIKCKQPPEPPPPPPPLKGDPEPTTKRKKNERKYCVVHYTGLLKSWVPAEIESGLSGEGDDEHASISCLVGVGRALPDLTTFPAPAPAATPTPHTRHLQYVSRHAIDGKFLFVDQRVTLALGFLPQELLGTSLYEYISGPELGAVARTHKQALLSRDALHTPPYSFRRKDGSLATIQTHFKPFRNPWTKDVECLVANNTITTVASSLDEPEEQCKAYRRTDEWREFLTGIKGAKESTNAAVSGITGRGDAPPPGPEGRVRASDGDLEVQRMIDSQMESRKIGSAIAEEACRRPPSGVDLLPLPQDLLQDPVFNPSSLIDNILGVEMTASNSVRNNVSLSDGARSPSPRPLRPQGPPPTASPPAVSPPLPLLTLDGNGEAAMAVIMSLLEADAGLGGPINISGLPWPLP